MRPALDEALAVQPEDVDDEPRVLKHDALSWGGDVHLAPDGKDVWLRCTYRTFDKEQTDLNEKRRRAALWQSPLPDRRPFLTMEVSGRHARTRAITRDMLLPANQPVPTGGDASRDVASVVSDVSATC
jgi:hypothetical protein